MFINKLEVNTDLSMQILAFSFERINIKPVLDAQLFVQFMCTCWFARTNLRSENFQFSYTSQTVHIH